MSTENPTPESGQERERAPPAHSERLRASLGWYAKAIADGFPFQDLSDETSRLIAKAFDDANARKEAERYEWNRFNKALYLEGPVHAVIVIQGTNSSLKNLIRSKRLKRFGVVVTWAGTYILAPTFAAAMGGLLVWALTA